MMAEGIVSSLQPDNERNARGDLAESGPKRPILFDPQTAGGLLIGLPASAAIACLADLHAAGYTKAAAIGEVVAETSAGPLVVTA
jgi:selenide,water dikinase